MLLNNYNIIQSKHSKHFFINFILLKFELKYSSANKGMAFLYIILLEYLTFSRFFSIKKIKKRSMLKNNYSFFYFIVFKIEKSKIYCFLEFFYLNL